MKEKAIELKKHVGIIHCANNLTLLQRKLSNALLYHAYSNLQSQEKHRIKLGEIQKLIDYDSHDYDTLKKAFKALMSVVLEWNLLKRTADAASSFDSDASFHEVSLKGKVGKAYSWHASSILASASISGNICTYSYSPELRELLYMPEVYGNINLLIQSRFTSTYSLALYENCIRFKKINHTGWISSEVFRRLMGVSDSKYKRYKDFKKRVLDKAVEEINKLSDIYVTPELRRDSGQQTFSIRFFLKNNNSFQNPAVKCNRVQNEKEGFFEGADLKIQQILKEHFYLSEKQIKTIINRYGTDYILSKINLVQSSTSYKNKKIGNISAYFLSAVKEDFQCSGRRSIVVDKKGKNREDLEVEKKLKQEKEYKKYVAEIITSFLEEIAVEKKKEIEEAFQKEMGKNPMKFTVDEFNKFGMKSSLIQAFYTEFVRKNYPGLIKIATFEEFVRNIMV